MKRSMVLLIALVIVGLLLTGCNRSQQGAQDEQVVAASIRTDCIAHYYKTDGSVYITQQQHGYSPSEGFFEAASTEPDGMVQCTLHKENYTSSDLKQRRLSDLPKSFGSKNLAIALFYSFCAGGDLLETGTMASEGNIKIEGRWYESLKPEWPNEINLMLLRAVDTKRIELVQLEDEQAGLTWLLKSYNTRYSKELSKKIPRTIDVFDIRNGVASKELMIRFDYKDIRKVGKQESPN